MSHALRHGLVIFLLLPLLFGGSAQGATLAEGQERPGSTYDVLKIEPADVQACRQLCLDDAKCKAYSYVKPGFQGNKARCWLKDALTPAWTSECCVSGVKDTVLPGDTQTFQQVTLGTDSIGDSLGLDLCLENGHGCGQPAADAFCQSQGFTTAVDFVVGRDAPPTKTIKDGAICDGRFCHRIASVTCVNQGTASAGQ